MKKIFLDYLQKKIFNKLSAEKKQIIKQKVLNLAQKTTKIGVSYNLFDGEELLPFSIKSIRNNVHYINVIYQTTSNFANTANDDLEKNLKKWQKEGLIDEIFLYTPDLNKSAHQNEIIKRNIGLQLAKKRGCKYFLGMDVDEFYDKNEFQKAIYKIIKDNIDASAVCIIEYLKSPENQIIGAPVFVPQNCENYVCYVPFLIKIHKFKKQKLGEEGFPCLVDPTRGLDIKGKFKLFPMHEIAMHHMSTVRKNLAAKYENSSALDSSIENQNKLKIIQEEVLNFDFESNKILPQNCSVFRENIVKKVENKFNIDF